jgi:hypothetical protein
MSSYKDSDITGFSHNEVAALILTALCIISHDLLHQGQVSILDPTDWMPACLPHELLLFWNCSR